MQQYQRSFYRNFSLSRAFDKVANKSLVRSTGYINGQWISDSNDKNGSFDVLNPANGECIAKLPRMSKAGTELSISAAAESFKKWKLTSAKERSKLLKQLADLMVANREDLATILTLEAGKPFKESLGEIAYATSFVEFYSEEAKRINGEVLQSPFGQKRLLALRQPVGPAALITPWNFPSAMITRKLAPALAAGCTVVIKPAEATPLSALAICALVEEAGIPPGVVNCLTVGREEVAEVGALLCHSSAIRKLSFTGSTPVGKWLMRECASTVKRISLELGGNAPFIVFDDADLDVALAAVMSSKFRNAGQACIATNRLLVQEGVYERFAAMLTEAVSSKLVCADGFHASSTIGPLINRAAVTKLASHVADCVARGGTVTTGGQECVVLNNARTSGNDSQDKGCFFEPTVITGATTEMLPFKQETFGPLIPMISFKTEEEAIAIANDTPFGLAGYACTKDLGRAWRVSEAIDAGMVGINDGAISLEMTPFGGVKESGIGREGGTYGIEEYLEVKYVCM
eukprot:CAMPEP_0170059152 /NCGR_PEP_ID=MMETSP0019_2-20121128/1529_1 /TAXON_ID=98059 /ORGANISM="Dinobryon sp., Strain UTEXLB2267" /LENGTH=517 /DNA_ID=CAMNT_0010264315 /DNA_START=52 /DNA_END=1602 /DNA_ORIENTATION=+